MTSINDFYKVHRLVDVPGLRCQRLLTRRLVIWRGRKFVYWS